MNEEPLTHGCVLSCMAVLPCLHGDMCLHGVAACLHVQLRVPPHGPRARVQLLAVRSTLYCIVLCC